MSALNERASKEQASDKEEARDESESVVPWRREEEYGPHLKPRGCP